MEIKNKWEILKAKGRHIYQLITDNHNSNSWFGVHVHVCTFIYISAVVLNTSDSVATENMSELN